jgi:hypothetical protein
MDADGLQAYLAQFQAKKSMNATESKLSQKNSSLPIRTDTPQPVERWVDGGH